MAGTKRLAVSDAASDLRDADFQGKRIMVGTPFRKPLDARRAQSSRQHVRALNSQFASWVQLQLKNHADELWEDGVRDYLSHASSIMMKYNDVVEWMRENTHKNEVVEKKVLDSELNRVVPEPFPPPYILGLSGFQNSHAHSGTQNSAPAPNDGSTEEAHDDDEEDEQQPSSPSWKKTEDTDVKAIHEAKCKLYVKSAGGSWTDKGMGNLAITVRPDTDSKRAIVIRNNRGLLLVNASIYKGIKAVVEKSSVVVVLHVKAEEEEEGEVDVAAVARTYLIRVKTVEDANRLAASIQDETAPPA